MKVPMTPENKAKCICMSCPTYTQNSLMGGVFCATGKSEKTPEMKGCVCMNCGVFAEYKLTGGYFCINGAAE
jgi:methylamine---glutamate N-methyltransferase subunit C